MKNTNIIESGKRKRAVARASIKAGTGVVRINKMLLDNYQPKLARLKLREPLLLAGDVASKVNVNINVTGGGIMSQAEAARLALAKALVTFTKSEELRDIYLNYDRTLLVGDVRYKEPSKPNRHGKARAKRQKSYR